MSDIDVIVDQSQPVVPVFQTLPFDQLIGGPLTACAKAQEMAADSTWNYIQKVGFSPQKGKQPAEALRVSFLFMQNGGLRELSIPLLSLVPIPSISLDSVDISLRADLMLSGDGELTTTLSNEKKTRETHSKMSYKYLETNQIGINIKASSFGMPAGLAKMIDLFSNSCIQIKDPDTTIETIEEEVVVEPEVVKAVDNPIVRKIKGEYIHAILEGIKIFKETDYYNVRLTQKLTPATKAKVIAAILKTTDNKITEEEILARANSTNKTIIVHVPLEKAEEIIRAIKNAGGNAEYITRIEVKKQTKSGENTLFYDALTKKNLTKEEFVKEIESGKYPDYHIRIINGVKTPVSNPDIMKDNNLN